jgi:DNA-binding CsgD family transcriptional regulator
VTHARHEGIHEIWDRLSDFPHSELNQALAYLFESTAALIGADDGFWLGTVRVTDGPAAETDHGNGWRMRATEFWRPNTAAKLRNAIFKRSQDYKGDITVGHTSERLCREAGVFRVHRMHDGWINFAAFSQTEHYDVFYREPRVDDRIWIVFPLNADTESYFCFDKIATASRFSVEDVTRATHVFRGIRWFHRQLLLSHGLPIASMGITAAERRVVQLLLSGSAEKEIATTLGTSFGTIHDHVAQLYRKFGVRSRAELMALWMGARR